MVLWAGIAQKQDGVLVLVTSNPTRVSHPRREVADIDCVWECKSSAFLHLIITFQLPRPAEYNRANFIAK